MLIKQFLILLILLLFHMEMHMKYTNQQLNFINLSVSMVLMNV